MGKTAFIFPGQGAQKIGMGRDFYEQIPECREIFETATRLLGFSMEELCFEENTRINETEYTQAAMVTVSAAILKALEPYGIQPDLAAGLSLGEYGALMAAGVLSFEDAVKIVRQRGILMQEEVPLGQGAMAAILGMDAARITEILNQWQEEHPGLCVQIANDNCPGQVVISGHKEAVDETLPLLKEAGAKRCVPLAVSGPFHSRMLAGAGEKLGAVLKEADFHDPRFPYVANVHAGLVNSAEEIPELLCRQVSSPVLWRPSVETMIAEGVDTFVEIGPGTTLSSFVRKINRQVKVCSIQTVEDLNKVVSSL